MVHDIDLMTYVLGEWPVEVFTSANAFTPEIGKLMDYDNVVSTFKFASGKCKAVWRRVIASIESITSKSFHGFAAV